MSIKEKLKQEVDNLLKMDMAQFANDNWFLFASSKEPQTNLPPASEEVIDRLTEAHEAQQKKCKEIKSLCIKATRTRVATLKEMADTVLQAHAHKKIRETQRESTIKKQR